MIVLVCGGRTFTDYQQLEAALNQLDSQTPITMIIHGDAKGADRMAGRWARFKGIHFAAVPALWDFYGDRAGGNRNKAMLNLPVEYCVAMPGGSGTADMVRRCEENGITIWRPYG